MNASSELVVLQPTPFCNLDCKYCYLPGREQRGVMSMDTLRLILTQVANSSLLIPHPTFLWHAGEPLVAKTEFYEKASSLIREIIPADISPVQAIQTNGTLIDEKWCRLFSAHNFRVGVSVDGPADIHDASRVDRSGRGTHDRTMRGIRMLQEHEIKVSVIMVLRASSLEEPERIFEFLVANDLLDVAFNVEEIEGTHKTSSLATPDAELSYPNFLRVILELRRKHCLKMRVRELDSFLGRILVADRNVKSICNIPLRVLSFDWKGNFSSFSPELLTMQHPTLGPLSFGNVAEAELLDLIQTEKFRTVKAEIKAGVDRCQNTCDYFSVCGGGHPSNKLSENQSFASTETMDCRLRVKRTCDMLLDYLDLAALEPAHC